MMAFAVASSVPDTWRSIMPHASAPALRAAVRQRSQQGQATADIARELHLCPRSVRHLLQRCRLQGAEALQPGYDACGLQRDDAYAFLQRHALDLRVQHP